MLPLDHQSRYGHLKCYSVNTNTPAYSMLGHSPVHFRDRHMIAQDDKGQVQCVPHQTHMESHPM
jgi:hypothetical protein